MSEPRLAFALDVPDLEAAAPWVSRLRHVVGVFKVGLELFVREGPRVIDAIDAAGAQCFLDLKLHDIPETVARAVASAGRHRVAFLTVHASGGGAMLSRARRAAAECEVPPRLLAVTALTSLSAGDVAEIGWSGGMPDVVLRLARLAATNGVTGFVCSAHEASRIRAAVPDAFIVTPGIRPAGAAVGDQQRVATATDAIRAGSNLLVVGRPIRDAADPLAVAEALATEIAGAAQ